MSSKNIVYFGIGGGFDSVNFLSPTDGTSVARVQALRAGATSNILNYVAPILVTGTLTAGSPTITGLTTSGITGLAVGHKVYGALVSGGSDTSFLQATRKLTVTAFDATTITMSGNATVSGSFPIYIGKVATAGTPTNGDALYPIYEPTLSGRAPNLHFTQNFLYDKINTANIVGNANKTKAALICNIGPLRKPLKLANGENLYVVSTNLPINYSYDLPASLTSHNDQASTVQSNAPEGSIKGWGGGIADTFVGSLSSNNVPLAAVSAANFPPFTAGDTVRSFGVGSNGLIFKLPNFFGNFTRDTAVNNTDQTTLIGLFKQAALGAPVDNSLATSATVATNLAATYQDILGSVPNITDPPVITFNIAGSKPINGFDGAGKLKTIARMLHANNPNRGATATRSGNTVTFVTEVGNGLANRTAGTKLTTITSVGHRLFTSNNVFTSVDYSDSVMISGTGLDSSPPTTGYRITVDPFTPNDVFSFLANGSATADTAALVNVPVTFYLKHNLTLANKVYIANTTETFDTAIPVNGYQVTSIPTTNSFTITTTNSGAFTGGATNFSGGTNPAGTMSAKFKLINLPNQVLYTESGMPLDSHSEATHSQLAGIDALITYFDSLVSRMVDADVVTFTLSEFGRTLSTNSNGTDHGWGANHFVFGKSVKGNAFYGDIMDYRNVTAGGLHLNSNMFMPTTSIYQYGATFARWMGATDAQVLALFPDLQFWNISQWYLGFL